MNAPYTFTRFHKKEGSDAACYVTIYTDDLFVTDSFTYGDLATAILDQCRDGKMLADIGGMLKMTDGRDDWGGFYLRIDAWDPSIARSPRGNKFLHHGNIIFLPPPEGLRIGPDMHPGPSVYL